MHFPTRKIGDTHVSSIGLGCMGLSIAYGPGVSDEEGFKVLDAAYESGCRFWDTANIYGDNELLLGKWFKRTGKRSDIFLATKFGILPSRSDVNGTPEYARQSIDQSLERLGIDHVDLFYLHRPDRKTPIEVTVGAMAELVKEGKTKYIGLSECSAGTLRRGHAIHPIAAYQVEYSPFTLDIEDPKIDLLRTCRELGITVIAYSPLARGLATGQYKSPDDFAENDFRRGVPRFSKENFPNILKVVDDLAEIGKKHDATPGQVSLAWLLAQGEDIIPIPGTKKLKYLDENLKAITFKLGAEELQTVRGLAEKADSAKGDRYPPHYMSALFGDTPPL